MGTDTSKGNGRITVLIKTRDGKSKKILALPMLCATDTYKVFGRPEKNDRDRHIEIINITFKSDDDLRRAGYGSYYPKHKHLCVDPKAF